ncbi:MAG: VOC family protein [Alphaproteobacteria bacterium]|tara:strand:- start:172 stop:753 length:582 start_codon:yes stop_codon:yes gene_type:complete
MTDTNALATRGIHHLALNTEDMKMTIDYYVDVLGMKLVHAMKIPPGLGAGPNNRGNPPYENLRHYFFDMGNDSLLAFFEMPKGEKQVGDRDAIAAMQHVSFSMLPDAFEALQLRLKERDIDTIGPLEVLPGVFSVYFFDPNGIRLEASCQPADGKMPRIATAATQTKSQARAELATLTDDDDWINKRVAALPD